MTGPRRQRAQVWAGVYAALFGAGVAESDTDDSAVRSSEHDPERDVA